MIFVVMVMMMIIIIMAKANYIFLILPLHFKLICLFLLVLSLIGPRCQKVCFLKHLSQRFHLVKNQFFLLKRHLKLFQSQTAAFPNLIPMDSNIFLHLHVLLFLIPNTVDQRRKSPLLYYSL